MHMRNASKTRWTDSLVTSREFRGIDGVVINVMIYCLLCAVIFPSRWPHPGNKSIGHSGLIVDVPVQKHRPIAAVSFLW